MISFLQGRKALAVAPLRPVTGTPSSVSTPAAKARATQATSTCDNNHPTIDVVKEGGKVVRIVVTCSCGERTEIECLYAGGV